MQRLYELKLAAISQLFTPEFGRRNAPQNQFSTGIAKHTFVRILKIGNVVTNIELIDRSFNCTFMSSFGGAVIYGSSALFYI